MAVDLKKTARILAYAAHDGVKRKYHDAAYFVHPERVAKRAEAMRLPDFAASYGHDIEEDCDDYFKALLRLLLPDFVVDLVLELTNVARPDLRRDERKALDREHLSKASYYAKVIKFLDRIDNIADMVDADRGFQYKYSAETMLLRDALLEGETDILLHQLAAEMVAGVAKMQTASMKKSLRR